MLKLKLTKKHFLKIFVVSKNLKVFLLLYLPILTQLSCNTTEPGEKPPVEPDSTTQNFTFETFEFGDGFSSSYLNDVWIFDENNIWAVGDIRLPEGYTNFIQWNGAEWKIISPYITSSGIEGIWAIDSSNIYFASGGIIKYENGELRIIQTNFQFTQGQGVHKLWGSSKNNIWGVGPNSTIVHYDGTAWSKIDFELNWRFDAITGSKQTGIAYASATSPEFNTIIVELKGNSATTIYNSANDPNKLKSFNLKLLDENNLLLGRTNIWKFNKNTAQSEILLNLKYGYSVLNLSVCSPKDIYYFIDKYGDGIELIHFNGKRYTELTFSNYTNSINGESFTIKDLAVMVGFINNKGYLVKVKRIK